MAGYQKNTWEVYDKNIPDKDQPDAFITKTKLDNIENGIHNAITDFLIGTVSKGAEVSCEIVADENDPSIKRINMVIPKEVSWLFSNVELYDQGVAPTGVAINDMILDSKGNIFTIIENSNGSLILSKKLNIKGQPGERGAIGADGKPGEKGQDGKNGNKWVFSNVSVFDGEEAPTDANVGDIVFDIVGDVFEVTDTLRLSKLFNIRGTDGKDGKDGEEYYLEIGDVISGDAPFASIKDHKLNLVLPIGPSGQSTYDLWKSLGYDGSADDFIEFLKSPALPVINNIDDILANKEQGKLVDALVVKELYLELKGMIEKLK